MGSGPFIQIPVCARATTRSRWWDGHLEVGLRRPLHVREEWLRARDDACRLLYVSDIHLRAGRSHLLCAQVLEAAARCRPHALLLGGDLVDAASELAALGDLIARLRAYAPVLAIGGNHDERVGIDRVRHAAEHAGARWIDHDTAYLLNHGRLITVSGSRAAPAGGHVRVICTHNPRGWRRFSDAGYDLVLAGHLHGCQLVACEYRNRLVPGALLYPHCVLRRRRGPTTLVVSRGVSDLLPFRWRCPREVVLCYV